MTTRPWRPIAPLEPTTGGDFHQDDDLRRQWLEHRLRAADSGLTALHRSWAVETGVIEGIYQLDEAQTRILVKGGFEPANVPLSGTDQDPGNLLSILLDHVATLDAIYGSIRNGRSISRSAIRQLHQVIVAHQPTYRAVNQLGQWFETRPHHGAFKTMPNNPTRPDGLVHQYCPPEHVDSEIGNLLNWYGEYAARPGVHHPCWWRHGSTTGSCRCTPLQTATAG